MDKLNLIIKPIATEFETFKELFEASFCSTNPLLNEMLTYIKKKRGKMMRPALTLLFAKVVGDVNDSVYRAAISLELLHTASLIHDDVVDDSDQRRGQSSVKGAYTNTLAVLVGDYLLATSLCQAALTGKTHVVELVARLGQQLADGEIDQIATVQNENFSIEAYFEVIKKKTAALFVTAAETGAVAAGGHKAICEVAIKMGEKMGIAFQIKDDLLDYFPSEVTGKSSGNDLREGKLTLPALYVLNHFPDSSMQQIALRIKSQEATEVEMESFMEYVKTNGGIDYAEEQIDAYCEAAIALLPKEMEEGIRTALVTYITYITERTK
ncbi:MAG: polyprenyl synthetase family protein [Phocaeicola sp.]